MDLLELNFEIEVSKVLKKTDKDLFFKDISDICSKYKAIEIIVNESYYIYNKSPDKKKIFVCNLNMKSSIKNIVKICNSIINLIYKNGKIHTNIYIKKNDILFAKYTKNKGENGHFIIMKEQDQSIIAGKCITVETIKNG